MGQRWLDTVTVMNAQAIAAGSTGYSNALAAFNIVGTYGGLHITTTATGGLTITQQCSLDGATWLDPTNATAAVGAILNAVAAVLTRFVQFTPVVAPYIRFKVVPGSTQTGVTLKYVTQGEKE